jgi:hypothetical protein
MSTPEISDFVRRANQPALFSIVLYARVSRTTESSFTHFKDKDNGGALEFSPPNRENSVLLPRILISIVHG